MGEPMIPGTRARQCRQACLLLRVRSATLSIPDVINFIITMNWSNHVNVGMNMAIARLLHAPLLE
jgi:hypothetical protein